MPISQKNNTQLIIFLRFFAIAIQALVITLAITVWHYQVELVPISIVIISELIFNFVSYYLLQKQQKHNIKASHFSLFLQIFADITFLSLLLYFSGGATNAFVSLLLIPIAISAVTLPKLFIGLITVSAVLSYSLLLLMLPEHHSHHVNMQQHFTGMWINFLFSALVVSIVVARMALTINQKERKLAEIREEQLKQEKLLTLGVASVQVTHQIATPIASVQLLVDELQEQQPDNVLADELQQELKRCQKSLAQFRQLASEVKQQKTILTSCSAITEQITEHATLNFPKLVLNWLHHSQFTLAHKIKTDASLMPALLNLIQNAQRANPEAINHIEVTSIIKQDNWHLSFRDFGKGFNLDSLAELGEVPVQSKKGLGMAVLLSHASLERLGIKLSLQNHHQGGAIAELIIPLIEQSDHNG